MKKLQRSSVLVMGKESSSAYDLELTVQREGGRGEPMPTVAVAANAAGDAHRDGRLRVSLTEVSGDRVSPP